MTVTPALVAVLTTARMTALSPGASPPPVRTPIFLIVGMQELCRRPSLRRRLARRSASQARGRTSPLRTPPRQPLYHCRKSEEGLSYSIPVLTLDCRHSERARLIIDQNA